MEIYFIIGGVFLVLLIMLFTSRKRVKAKYDKYIRIDNDAGVTGNNIAAYANSKLQLGLSLSLTDTKMGDAYSPKHKTLILSKEVNSSASIASMAIVAHEIGHAMQDKNGTFIFRLNNFLKRLTHITNKFIIPLLLFGLLFHIFKWPTPKLGITLCIISGVLFVMHALLKLLTIPVEYDASNKALDFLTTHKLVTKRELGKVTKLLRTAGQTYIQSLFDGFIISYYKVKNFILRR